MDELAKGIITLKKCEADLLEKQILIEERLNTFKGPQEQRLWWQEPSFVGFGLVGSFFLGVVVAYSATR